MRRECQAIKDGGGKDFHKQREASEKVRKVSKYTVCPGNWEKLDVAELPLKQARPGHTTHYRPREPELSGGGTWLGNY